MVHIPNEIWLHITSYLSQDEIWRLRYLNRVLFDTAMDNRYRTLDFSITFRDSTQYIQKFGRFRDPDVAKRVRRISYFDRASTVFPVKRRTKMISLKNRLKSLFTKSLSVDLGGMANTMACFTNLVSLDLRFLSFVRDDCFEDCVPLIHTNFRTCFAQLQSLVLNFPLIHFRTIILPDLFFPCLTSLNMTFFGPTEEATFVNVVTTTILPFTNRHAQSLSSVFFRSLGGTSNIIDTSLFFQGLGHFPSLRSVEISMTSLTQPPIIARFLELHRETLRDIEIRLTHPPYTLVDGLFRFVTKAFPNLEDFTITCIGFRQSPVSEQSLDPTTDFIRKCSPSLVSLDILASVHSTRKLRELLIPQRGDQLIFGRLRHLYISVHTLTPDVLDMLASQLPNLHSLELFTSSLKYRETLPDIVIDFYKFSLEMARRNYSSWKLEHLTLFFGTAGRATNSPGPMAIARAIPSLKTLNGIVMSKPT